VAGRVANLAQLGPASATVVSAGAVLVQHDDPASPRDGRLDAPALGGQQRGQRFGTAGSVLTALSSTRSSGGKRLA
jgi:hypothetical protein